MIKSLILLLVVVNCGLAGKHRKNTRKARKWPSEKPTSDPTEFLTSSQCSFDKDVPHEIVMVVDNSCGLSKDECDVQQKQIGEIFRRIKVDDDPFYTQIAYIEYCSDGAETRIGLKDWEFQKDADKFYDFILNKASCGGGGSGKTDVITGLNYAINEYLYNGDNECDPKRKIIMINNCEKTQYKYDDHNTQFDEILDQLKDVNYFQSQPDLMMFNVPYPAKNAISLPHDYLSFVIPECDESTKGPKAGYLCVAPSCSLNDGKITSTDYMDAAVVIDGKIRDKDDKCLDKHRLCEFVNEANKPMPTKKPTQKPSYKVTKDPTKRPTENDKVCLKIVYKASQQIKDECKTSEWEIRLNGDRDPMAIGGFDGDECIQIHREKDYTLKVKNGCGKIQWFVDGKQCGVHTYPKDHSSNSEYVAMDFPIKCRFNGIQSDK